MSAFIIPPIASDNNPLKTESRRHRKKAALATAVEQRRSAAFCPNAQRIARKYADGSVTLTWVPCKKKTCPVCRKLWQEQYLETLGPLAIRAFDLREIVFRGPDQKTLWRRFRRILSKHNAPWAKITTESPLTNGYISVLFDAANLPPHFYKKHGQGAHRTIHASQVMEALAGFVQASGAKSHLTLGGPWKQSRPHGKGGGKQEPAAKPVEQVRLTRQITPDVLKAVLAGRGIEYTEGFARWSHEVRWRLAEADRGLGLMAYFSIRILRSAKKSRPFEPTASWVSPPDLLSSGAT